MDNNKKLEELYNRQKDLTSKMNEAESKRNNDIYKMSMIEQQIAELQKKLEELNSQKDTIAQTIGQLDAEKVTDTVELGKIKAEIEQIEAEKKAEEANNSKKPINVLEYNKMISEYNKRLASYNKNVTKLYNLQKQYEAGKIKYEKYLQFAMPLSKEYNSLQSAYNTLHDASKKLKNSIEFLTDEQLNERLTNLKNEAKQPFTYNTSNLNSDNGINIVRLGKINSDILEIQIEQAIRRTRKLTDQELSNSINILNKNLESGEFNQDNARLTDIKESLKILTFVQNERKENPYISLTDKQIDDEIDRLNDEYINEWNYSVHVESGMEANDISKLDEIKKKIDTLNNIKTNRGAKLEVPKAPEKAMFIMEKQEPTKDTNVNKEQVSNNQVSNDSDKAKSQDNNRIILEPSPNDPNAYVAPSFNNDSVELNYPITVAKNHSNQSPTVEYIPVIVDNNFSTASATRTAEEEHSETARRVVLTESDVEKLQKDKEEEDKKLLQNNRKKPDEKVGLFKRVRNFFSKKDKEVKSLPKGQNVTTPDSVDNYDDSDMKIYEDEFGSSASKPYFRELKNFVPNTETVTQPTNRTTDDNNPER